MKNNTINKHLLFRETIQVNNTGFDVTVNIVQEPQGQLQYFASINNLKDIELSINENGNWYYVQGGVTELSEAIGNLIENKTL